MAFNVTDHSLVPDHKKLTKEEKEALLEKYHITVKELPRVLESDPSLQGVKVGPGDVVRITRNSPTAGKAVYFRVVVRG